MTDTRTKDQLAWTCDKCGQRNTGWATTCGRCETSRFPPEQPSSNDLLSLLRFRVLDYRNATVEARERLMLEAADEIERLRAALQRITDYAQSVEDADEIADRALAGRATDETEAGPPCPHGVRASDCLWCGADKSTAVPAWPGALGLCPDGTPHSPRPLNDEMNPGEWICGKCGHGTTY